MLKKVFIAKSIKKVNNILRCYCTSNYIYPSPKDGYTETPEYPPIRDLSPKAQERDRHEEWYAKIQRQLTVEEKLFEINVPRYYGWKCVMLREGHIPYNTLNFIKYITRTGVVPDPPAGYNDSVDITAIKNKIQDELEYQLSLSYKNEELEELEREKEHAKLIVNALHRVLRQEVPFREDCITDFEPRLETFWSVGGIEPPESVIARRKKEKVTDEKELKEPVNRWIQYLGADTVLQCRSKNPLENFWPRDKTAEVPVWERDPEYVGFKNEYRHGTSIPGFWPGDELEFGLLSYHLCNHIKYRPPTYGADESQEALLGQGLLASFCWLTSLAAYQGFSPFSEITYPFTTQTILTDGRNFTTMAYQMNTNLIHSDHCVKNPYTNLIWSSPTESLFETIENGKVIGLNDAVIKRLLNIYLNAPKAAEGVNLKPYLGESIKHIADYEDEEKRSWLEREFKHFSANRPRHRKDLIYEVYEWERIYKIEHKMRFQDARRRPFELNERPFQRKMSDSSGEYIPKALRPDKDLPRYKQRKFRKTFYPE